MWSLSPVGLLSGLSPDLALAPRFPPFSFRYPSPGSPHPSCRTYLTFRDPLGCGQVCPPDHISLADFFEVSYMNVVMAAEKVAKKEKLTKEEEKKKALEKKNDFMSRTGKWRIRGL